MYYRNECPICSQAAPEIFSRSYASRELDWVRNRFCFLSDLLSGNNFTVRYCQSCDFVFQEATPEGQELAVIYGTHSISREAILDEISHQKLHWFAHMTEEILVMRQMLKSDMPKVLDYGANWGKWASMAQAHGCDVYAVELNPVAADFCRSRGIRVIAEEELSLHKFDFINVDQVLEHLGDPVGVAKKLGQCLSKGGYLKFSVPHNKRLKSRLQMSRVEEYGEVLSSENIDALDPLVHLNLFSNASLNALAMKSGLKPVRLPFWKWLGAGQLWNIPRQLNRNLLLPKKRALRQGNYLWFSSE